MWQSVPVSASDLALKHRHAVIIVEILNNAILSRCVSSHVVLYCTWWCIIMPTAASLH